MSLTRIKNAGFLIRLRPCVTSVYHKSSKVSPDLPDYTTSVNVHEHKLSRPARPPPSPKIWDGLKDLENTTKGSLIPDTLKEMDSNEEFQETQRKLKQFGQKKLTREERKNRQRALSRLGVPHFLEFWKQKQKESGETNTTSILKKREPEQVQLNIGIYCNQACNHCHVESSPKRLEMMNRDVATKCLDIIKHSSNIQSVDITGGAPELCSEFRYLAKSCADMGKEVIDRCNLTALLEPGQEDTAEFLAENGIRVIASLPCYSSQNVNMQRGKGVFAKSIQALINLNKLGYGVAGSDLKLDLVYNPLGAFLPPPQAELKDKYKEELWEHFGVQFNDLFTMTNMPIKRFADFLYRRNELEDYMSLLIRNYNLSTMDSLMCRNVVSVNWDGHLYDCDFNQQLDLPINGSDTKTALTVFDIKSTSELKDKVVATDNHCYGCSAGMGSS